MRILSSLKRKSLVPACFLISPTVVLLGFISLWGSDSKVWSVKEPAAWTLQDAEQILWQSPWVRHHNFRFFNSRRRVRQITYYVRLQSALPVRLALAKAFLSQPESNVVSVKDADPEQMLTLSERLKLTDELVLSLIISPQFFHRRLNELSLENLKRSSCLYYGRRKIGLKDFVPPEKTTFGEAWFRFPRPETEPVPDKIRFVTKLEIPYRVSVNVEFDTAALHFLGQVEY